MKTEIDPIEKAACAAFACSRVAAILLAAASLGAAPPSQGDAAVLVPAGFFTMGADIGPDDERPQHRIHLAAYTIDRYPVTNRAFAEFLNASGPYNAAAERLFDVDDPDARVHRAGGKWTAQPGFELHPVVEVSWAGARDYCAWRGKRLPTEAEWEKAARGTDGRRYPWGNEQPDSSRARYASGWNATVPVGSFPQGASPYGVHDMAGNVWQWVSSAYRPYPYRADDGREASHAGPARGTRGGGHDSPAADITTTQRGSGLSRNPRSGHHNIGFRCAK